MTSLPSFSDFFKALWKFEPFPWQAMLSERIADGSWPGALDLPTAAGKTACIDAAIWALAHQADKEVSKRTAPRRIWFVVDRRIVVDEAFSRASDIAKMLQAATNGPIKEVADRLRQVSGTEQPLAVARLRGGILRDDGWARLPSQPAVITSTVDQLGSRLLFRGYGRSHLTAPIFAGLAAHDSLILLDEAHCSVPFLQTLRAIEHFRGESWAECPIATPFAFSILSATPPPDISEAARFPGPRRDEALDHPVLRARLEASKTAELVVLKTKKASTDDPLITEAAKRAKSYIEQSRKRRVAVIVNRVRTAMDTASILREQVGDSVHVALLTGRLRPFERDQLVERWKQFLKAHAPQEPDKPIMLISTQCIEVGADFSFDALVTEAASLDALRQRFGRLNRMGNPGTSPATILVREKDTKEDAQDPVYGASIAECWHLIEKKASLGIGKNPTKTVDFGIKALDGLLADVEDLSAYLAPTPDAPMLLPAHLDLLCQTAPLPSPEPDIQLYLHGVGRGPPEARVVWRADLDPDHTDMWAETVALCPPTSAEALSVPLFRLREWLAKSDSAGDVSDVEGAALDKDNGEESIRPVFLWAGRDRSRVIQKAADIWPNVVVVVPAAYGMMPLGQSEPVEAFGTEALDLWEVARLETGKPPALRLHRAVLAPWMDRPALKNLVVLASEPVFDRQDLGYAIDAVLNYRPEKEEDPPAPPDWLCDLLRQARNGRRVERHPGGGLVLFAHQSNAWKDTEPDLFADDDDLLSVSGQEVSLAVHSESVRHATAKFTARCLPPGFIDPLKTAAYWHDVGKLDARFQVLLHQGDEVAAVGGEPLAKSADIPSSPARRRAIREASGLPENFRHEMLSFQLAEQHAPLPDSAEMSDLILHLIASHHGHGRPFAPVCLDPAPPSVRGAHDGISIHLNTDERASLVAPHAVASGISERFWRLTRRYGWWGLAYLETVLRLGDWYGSRFVVQEASPQPVACPSRLQKQESASAKMELSGVDGANPLGFLAAIGTLVVLHAAGQRGARLSWKRAATWQPVLSGISTTDRETLASIVTNALRGNAVAEDAERNRAETQSAFDIAKKAIKDKQEEIKKRHLGRTERQQAIEAEVAPLDKIVLDRKRELMVAQRQAVPRPELALGRHIDCTAKEFRGHAERFLDGAGLTNREPLDLLAAFASDACLHASVAKQQDGSLAPTPFCFTTGSGNQWFLDTVRQLLSQATPARVQSVLFEPWTYRDPKLSMRWDPIEDKRYALTDTKPADEGAATVWMANLLAYRALALFASCPRRGDLATTAWSRNDKEPVFTWPLWQHPSDLDTIRSMLLLSELGAAMPNRRALRARGIVEVFRARRIKVGAGANFKINFGQARGV